MSKNIENITFKRKLFLTIAKLGFANIPSICNNVFDEIMLIYNE